MENARQMLGVFLAGGLGACLRVGLTAFVDQRTPKLPYGTLVVNLIGCLVIGFAAAWLRGPWRVVVIGGLLGGFTTYSSFALMSWELMREQRVGEMGLQIAAHLVGGVIAVAVGMWVGELVGAGER